jgi:hypothetical protein
MRIRLIRKLADEIDGIDVSDYKQGDVFELPRHEAELLLAEGWVVPDEEPVRRAGLGRRPPRQILVTTTSASRRTVEQLRRLRDAMALKHLEEQVRQRAEDRIREELHDARATTIKGSCVTDDAEGH